MAEGRGGVVKGRLVGHTTPSARLRKLRVFILIAQPPLLLLLRNLYRNGCQNKAEVLGLPG